MPFLRTSVAMLIVAGLAAAAGAQPTDAETIFESGRGHLRDGRPSLALDQFKRAVKLEPKNAYFYKGLGLALTQLKKYDEAVATFRKALELNQYFTDVRNDLGMALVLSGKREEGKQEFLAAYNEPTNPSPEFAAVNLGQAYLEDRNLPVAADWFRTAVSRSKAFPGAYVGLYETLLGLGRAEEALHILETGSKEVPESAALLLRLGIAYKQAGRLAEARTRFEDASRRDPVGPDGKRALELLRTIPGR